jgi:hypothetical protein
VKAGAIRKLAAERTLQELEDAANSIIEHETDLFEVEGDDLGERLTNIMLAARVRTRTDLGEDLKDAFRAEMAAVRGVMSNE